MSTRDHERHTYFPIDCTDRRPCNRSDGKKQSHSLKRRRGGTEQSDDERRKQQRAERELEASARLRIRERLVASIRTSFIK